MRAESVHGVIGDLDRFTDAVIRDDRQHRPENLFLRDRHRRRDLGEHRRSGEKAARHTIRSIRTAADELGAFLQADTDHLLHTVELGAVRDRAVCCLLIARIANDELCDCRSGQRLDVGELAAWHDHPRRRAAGLADVTKGRGDTRRNGFRQIGIGQDNVRRLAAEFLCDAFYCRRGGLRHQHAGAGRACDRNHVDVGMRRHGCTDLRTVTVHEIEDTRRNAGVVQHFGEQQRAEGRQFTGFEHHRAPGGQRRSDFRRDLVQGPVPWRDQAANADRFAHDRRRAPRREQRKTEQVFPGDAQVFGGERNLRRPCVADRRAHFRRQRLRQELCTFQDQSVDTADDVGTVFDGGFGPGRKRASGCGHRPVNVGCAAEPDLGHRFLGRRVDHGGPFHDAGARPVPVDVSLIKTARFMEVLDRGNQWNRSFSCFLLLP